MIHRKLEVRAGVALVVGVLVLAATEVVIVVDQFREQTAIGQLTAARAMEADNLNLEVAMVNQETGLMGYVATGQQVLLKPYDLGRAQLGPLLRSLDRRSRGTPYRGAVGEVETTATAWSAWAAARKTAVDAAHGPAIDQAADQQGDSAFEGFRAADARLAALVENRLLPSQAAVAASGQSVRNALLVGGSIVSGTLLLLSVILVLSTLRPIAQLAATADKLAAGEPVIIPGTQRSDEVGTLARALEHWHEADSIRETMIEHAPIGIAHLGETGQVVAVNREMVTMFRRSREDLLRMTYGDATTPEYLQPSRRVYEDVTSGQHDRGTMQKQYMRGDGTTFWGEMTLASVRDTEGEVRSSVAMVIDVTDRKEKLSRAAAVQRGLLPKVVPMLRGYELTGHCMLAEEVGGDFFDWYITSPGQLTLTLGDVMGKGMSAAILMATVRATLRATTGSASPSDAVRVAASSVAMDLDESQSFVTLFHARLDQASGGLSFVDAGHGLAFVRRSSGEVVTFPNNNLPIGVNAAEEYRESAVQLRPGDTFVVFSDGVLDLYPGLENDFRQLAPVLQGASTVTEIVARLCTQGDGLQQYDDVTVIALQRLADASASRLLLTEQGRQIGGAGGGSAAPGAGDRRQLSE